MATLASAKRDFETVSDHEINEMNKNAEEMYESLGMDEPESFRDLPRPRQDEAKELELMFNLPKIWSCGLRDMQGIECATDAIWLLESSSASSDYTEYSQELPAMIKDRFDLTKDVAL